MSLTGAASRWLRNKPYGSITTWEDLKTKCLRKYFPPARTAKKMKEINNFRQEPDETLYQAWKRFKELLVKFPQHYLMEMHSVILFYNGLDVQTRQILDSKGVIPSKTVVDAKVAIQEIAEYSQKWHNGTSRTRRGYREAALGFYQRNNANPSYQERRQSMEETLSKFMSEAAKRHEENYNMIKQIRASTDVVIRNHEASIKTLEIQIGKISKNKRLMFESRHMTIPCLSCLNDYYCEEKKGLYGPQFSKAYSYGALHINKSIPQKEKDPRSFTLPCYTNNVFFDNALADLGASISGMPLSTYLNLGLGELAHTKLTVKLANRTMKYPKAIAEIPEDVKVPLILGRPFLSTAHTMIDVFKRKITLRVGDEKIIFKSVQLAIILIKRVYMLSLREIMELNLEARLMSETLVLNKPLDHLYGDYFELNDLNVPLELRRDQVDDLMPTIEEGEGVLQFFNKGQVVENIDGYRDQDMGDIILREPFCKASCLEARSVFNILTRIQILFTSFWRIPGYGYGVLDLAEKKSTMLVKYLQSGILAHKLNTENLPSKISREFIILIHLILIFNALSIQQGRCIIQVGDGN
nr:hypothetical protein [Tanacetum cinerariifolium]